MNTQGVSLVVALAMAVLAGCVVVLLYQIQDRRPRVTVTFGALVRAALGAANLRRRERLRRIVSIVIHLALVTLLVASMLAPGALSAQGSTSPLVVLFDMSASMMAREAGTTRFALARNALLSRLAELPDATEVLLLTADAQTGPLLPWTHDRDSLVSAILRLQPVESSSNFSRSLATAAQYISAQPLGRLLVVTDGTISDWESLAAEPGLSTVPIEAIAVGSEAFNVGITNVAARLQRNSPRLADLLVQVVNGDRVPHELALEVKSRGRQIASRGLRLAAQEEKTIHLTDLEARHHVFEVHVGVPSHQQDALALDDTAHAVLPEIEKTHVSVITRGNLYLEAAVLSDEFIEARFLSPEAAFDPADVDAIIYDGVEPPTPLVTPSFIINPPVGNSRVQVGDSMTQAGFDTWDHSSPWLRDLDLYDVQIDQGHALLLQTGDQALAYSGKRPILTTGRREGMAFVAVGFDASHSDFVLRPIWPLFVRQVLEQLLGRNAAAVNETRPWQAISMPAESRAARLRVLGPKGVVDRSVAAGEAWWFVPNHVGLYETIAAEHHSFVAANLDSTHESRIQTLRPLTYGGRPLPVPRRKPGEAPRMRARGVAIAALILLIAEWFAFHRRWTS